PPSTVTAPADRPGSEAPSLLPSAPAHLAVLDAFWATDGAAPVPEDPGPLLQDAGPEAPPAPPEPSGIAVAEPTVVLAPLSAMPAILPSPFASRPSGVPTGGRNGGASAARCTTMPSPAAGWSGFAGTGGPISSWGRSTPEPSWTSTRWPSRGSAPTPCRAPCAL